MRVRLVHPYPALIAESDDGRVYLVAADLHIGFEHELVEKGIHIDDGYVHEMLCTLLRIAGDEHCDGVILLGDVKNTIRGISREERISIPEFMNMLSSSLEVYVVPGNHDSYLERLLPDSIRITSSRGIVIDDTLFTHGHAIPPAIHAMGVRRIVMGHIHPTLSSMSMLDDERVWVLMRFRLHTSEGHNMLDLVLMPSFNRYISLYLHRRRSPTSPVLRDTMSRGSLIRAVVLTLDGSIVGDENHLPAYLLGHVA